MLFSSVWVHDGVFDYDVNAIQISPVQPDSYRVCLKSLFQSFVPPSHKEACHVICLVLVFIFWSMGRCILFSPAFAMFFLDVDVIVAGLPWYDIVVQNLCESCCSKYSLYFTISVGNQFPRIYIEENYFTFRNNIDTSFNSNINVHRWVW